jgi:HEAT repeat protein
LLNDSGELIRAAAVSALVSAGEKQAALAAAGDKSWRVRQSVAQSLAGYPDRESAATLQQFLTDPSAPVQQQAIASMAEWPLERSGPILLEAMGKSVYTTRKASTELLARRWPPARQFSADAPSERRSEILNQLQQEFRRQIGLADTDALAARGAIPPGVSEDLLGHVQLLVRQLSDPALADAAREQAVAELKALGAGGVEAMECVALDRGQPLPQPVYHDVLPACEPAFAAIDRMASDDVLQRRRAASDLAELAAKHPLRRLAMARLAEQAAAETDPLVWQSVLSAAAADGSEPAIRLAAAAIGHCASEVRLRACEYLASHPDPGHVPLLVPALQDENDEVAATAARALGLSGHMENLGPLQQKLGARNEMVQLEAAVALVRLGDESGIAALERLSYSKEEGVRRHTAKAMGEAPNPAFVPVLIRLLDDHQSVRVAALAALPKVAGEDVAARPGQRQPRMAEHVELWKRWFQDSQGSRVESREPEGTWHRDSRLSSSGS